MAGRSTLSSDGNRLTWPHGQRADPRGVFPGRRGAEEGEFLLSAKALGLFAGTPGSRVSLRQGGRPWQALYELHDVCRNLIVRPRAREGAARIGSAFETS